MEQYIDLYIIMAFLVLAALATAIIVNESVISIRSGVKTADKKIAQIIHSATESPELELSRYPEIGKKPRINLLWTEYLNAMKRTRVPSAVNVETYFNYDRIFENNVRLQIADVFPVLLSVLGTLASALLLFIHTGNEGLDTQYLYTAIEGVLLGLIFMLFQRSVSATTQKAISKLVANVDAYTNHGMTGSDVLLSEISLSLMEQNSLQLENYERMSQKTSERFAESVIPVLQKIEGQVETFISAATERQAESMENLAGLFVEKMNAAYNIQFEKLGNIVSNMVHIQEASAESFESMRGIAEASAGNLSDMQKSIEAVFVDFGSYLDRLGGMGDALTENLGSITKINDYMRENAQAQTETIKTLSDYEKELTLVSGQYTSTMNTVISDIRDQYSSTMVSLRSITGDMLQSGEQLRSAYGSFSSSTVTDVETIFKHFDENLTSIYAHLAKNIGDLQDAVDELPAILKTINISPDRGEST